MAVQIPVIIDIDSAFQTAASRVQSAMKPLQAQLDNRTLKLNFDFKENGAKISVLFGDILNQTDALKQALSQIPKLMEQALSGGSFADVAALKQAETYITQYLSLINNGKTSVDQVEKSLGALQGRLSALQSALQSQNFRTSEWRKTAKEIGNVSAKIDEVTAKMRLLGTKTGSLDRLNIQLRQLQDKWNALGAGNFHTDGSLSKQAQNIQAQYTKVFNEIEAQSRRLSERIEAQRREALRHQKQAEMRVKIETDNYRLNKNAKSLNDLYAQERILSERLRNAVIGSKTYTDYQNRLEQVREKIASVTGQAKQMNKEMKTQGGLLSSLSAALSYYVSIYAAFRFIKKIRDVTAELEYQRVALGNLIQDVDYGNRLFKQVQDLAVESPFKILDISKYVKQLAAYQIGQYDLLDTTKRLADVSAGLGVSMDRLILAYGQVRAASVLRGQELRQFTEAGIPLVDKLAEKLSDLNGKSVSTAEVFKLISQRAVSFELVAEIFEEMTDKGGMFYNMQAKQAETLKGKWAKLIDVYDIALQRIGTSSTFTRINDQVLAGLNLLARNIEIIPKAMAGVTTAFLAYKAAVLVVNIVNGTLLKQLKRIGSAAASLGTKAGWAALRTNMLAAAETKLAAANSRLEKTFLRLWIAMLKNPIAAAIALIGGIIAMIVTFRKHTEDLSSEMEKYDKVIEATNNALKDYNKTEKIITRYERLTRETERTVKEQTQLYHTLSLLEDKFPSVSKNIDGTTEELVKQVQTMRDLNEAARNNARLTAETTLAELGYDRDEARKTLDKLYKKRNKLYENQRTDAQAGVRGEVIRRWNEEIDKQNKKIAEQEELVTQLQKRYQNLYYLLHPEETKSPLNAWQQAIYNLSKLSLNGNDYQLFTLNEVEAFESLDKALDEIGRKKKNEIKTEEQLEESYKVTSGEIREQIAADEELARQKKLQYEMMEDLFKLYTEFGKYMKDDYSDIIKETFDASEIEQYYTDLLNYLRPYVKRNLGALLPNLKDLLSAGWGGAEDILQKYEYADSTGKKHTLTLTPVLPDGSILKKAELDSYVKKLIDTDSPIKADFEGKKLIIGVDFGDNIQKQLDDQLSHLDKLMKGHEVKIGRFLVTDADLKKLDDATDMIDLVDKKIGNIEKEIRRIDDIKIENLSGEQVRLTREYGVALNEVYAQLLKLRGETENYYSDIEEDFSAKFPDLVQGIRKVGSDKSTLGLFSNSELKNIKSIIDLQSLWASKIKKVRDEQKKYNATLMSKDISEATRANAQAAIASLKEQEKLLVEVQKRYGFVEDTKGKGTGSDPWVLLFKNRESFVKDFRSEVEKLSKSLSRLDAIARTRTMFEGRGLSLGFNGKEDIDVRKMTGSMEEVEKWYETAIDKIKKRIQSLGGKEFAGLGVKQILAKDVKKRTVKELQDVLAALWKEFTGIKADDLSIKIEKDLEKVKNDVQRSETARNFYNDILSQTGDEGLATELTVSVYGDIGEDFGERIQEVLNKAMANMNGGDFTDELKKALETQDWDTILAHLDAFPKAWQDELKELAKDSQKYDADFLKNFISTHKKAKSVAEQIETVRKTAAKDRAEIQAQFDSGKISEGTYNQMMAQSKTGEEQDVTKLNIEALKMSYEWTKTFEDLDNISTETLNNIITKIKEIIKAQGQFMTPEQLKALTEALNKAETESVGRSPLRNTVNAARGQNLAYEYIQARSTATGKDESGNLVFRNKAREKSYNELRAAIEKYNETAIEANKIDLDHPADSVNKLGQNVIKGLNEIQDGLSEQQDLVSGIQSAYEASKEFFELGDSSEMDGLLQGAADALQVISTILPVIISLQAVLNALVESNPLIAAAAVIIATLGAIVGLIRGITNAKNEKLKKQIDELKQHAEALSDAFDKLSDAEDKALGSAYAENYQQEISNLQAQKTAAEEQLSLANEMSESTKKQRKDRKAAIKSATESINEVNEKLEEMKGKLAEYYTGTDLTSAAQDFAKAWLDAYVSFSNTSDALKEKFNDMIQNMVVNSVMAKAVEAILQPFFDEIDQRASEHNGLDEEDIAWAADQTLGLTNSINTSLTAWAERLKSAGLNLRGTASSMSGISKEIASASEESIQGLAAGINTQNYYMSYMPTISANVIAILAFLRGETATPAVDQLRGRTASTSTLDMTFGDETFRGQMNRLDVNIAELTSLLRSVTQPRSANVATKVVAVKTI